eukprot:3643302-Prymnesium_polylepis.2
MRLFQGSGVAALPQGSKLATHHVLACTSGGLGAPRGTTVATVPPLLRGVRTDEGPVYAFQWAFQAKIENKALLYVESTYFFVATVLHWPIFDRPFALRFGRGPSPS